METQRDYYLLLVDFRAFTQLSSADAQSVMDRVSAGLVRINSSLRPKPVIDLTLSYGDEVAGLFANPDNIFDCADDLRNLLYPNATMRFVAARGRIAVRSKDIRRVGGSVFKVADEAMKRIKKKKKFCCWLLGDPVLDAVLDSLVELSNSVIMEMTSYQREVFSLLCRGLRQKDIAAKLNKHPQSVSDVVKRGKAELVVDAQNTVRALLSARGRRLHIRQQGTNTGD